MTKEQNNILISACLLGNPVRYNGTDLLIEHPLIKRWQKEFRLIPFCPEIAGGMSVPRSPAEISSGDGYSVLSRESQVINNRQQNVTKDFISGANKALDIARENNCIVAILTEGSPSCGSRIIYDSSFSGTKKEGVGVTAALLEQHSIRVFNQHQLKLVKNYLSRNL